MTDNHAPEESGEGPARRDEQEAIRARGRRRLLQGGAGAGAFVTVLANRPTFSLAQSGSAMGSCTHSGPCTNTDIEQFGDGDDKSLPEQANGNAHGHNKPKKNASGFETGGG